MDKKLIDPLKLGMNLKKYIKTIGYKVKDIQNYLCLECPQPIYRWFKGSTYPSIHHLYALSCLFGVSMNELVEESDERNVAISNSAKATGFEVMTCLFSITILVMALLGYLTKGVFFTFIGVFSIAQISFVIRLLYLQRTM